MLIYRLLATSFALALIHELTTNGFTTLAWAEAVLAAGMTVCAFSRD